MRRAIEPLHTYIGCPDLPLSVETSHFPFVCGKVQPLFGSSAPAAPTSGNVQPLTPSEAAPERCYFLIIFCCKIWRFYSNEKIIDNSTYIVGIYDSAEKADLYTLTVWGCCLICITGPPIPYNRIRQKIDFPHLSCTPKFNPFSPGIEEHNNH